MTSPHAPVYGLHGLRVRSAVPLSETIVGDEAIDVEVELAGEASIPFDPPPGEVVAEFVGHGRRWYTATRHRRGYTLRFHGCCDVDIDGELRTVLCTADPSADGRLLPIVIAGTALAFLLTLRGHTVLHASAVEWEGRVVAFVGRSGVGKSTLAALCCAAGGKLVTDDVLRIDVTEGPRCVSGSSELRLRPAAREIIEHFAVAPAHRQTVDARWAVGAERCSGGMLNVAALVVPLPSRDRKTVEITRVVPLDAQILLASFPRVYGWRHPEHLRLLFEGIAALTAQVPLFTARVPWGPPFSPRVATELIGLLALGQRDLPPG